MKSPFEELEESLDRQRRGRRRERLVVLGFVLVVLLAAAGAYLALT